MLKALSLVLLVLLILAAFNYKTIRQMHYFITFFDEDRIVSNFLNIEHREATHLIEKSPTPTRLPKEVRYKMLDAFSSQGKTFQVKEYLDYTRTTGLLLIHKDTIIYEAYSNGMEETTTHISWSVAKSFVSALLGIALEDGVFESIEDPITKYLPQFKDSGYNNVRIKDILQMSSGVGFNEDYRDFYSDINRFGRHIVLGKPYEEFALSLKSVRKPGTFNHYVSIDTQVLGMLVRKVTGKSLADYAKEKLWDPLGMEHDAQWIVDGTGMEMALGGLNVTLRDYAKMGLLFLHEGNWKGKQIVSKEWVRQSVTPDAPHLMPGEHELSATPFGYGYQWWIPEQPDGDFFAAGIYNQYIYINPKKELVIVKTSANHHFKEKDDQSKLHHVDLFQAMAKAF